MDGKMNFGVVQPPENPKIPFDKTLKSAYNEGGEGNFSAGKDGQNIFHS